MVRISTEEAYEILGLTGEGEKPDEEIKKAYRKRSLATHPDKNPVGQAQIPSLVCCSSFETILLNELFFLSRVHVRRPLSSS